MALSPLLFMTSPMRPLPLLPLQLMMLVGITLLVFLKKRYPNQLLEVRLQSNEYPRLENTT